MALDKSALLELTEALSSADGGQLMRRLLHTILQALIDAEAAEHIGADPHERTEGRTTYRNGTRDKTVSTTSGDLTVKIAKTRTGTFFPSLLTPRRRIDVALHAVVMEAYVHGVSTRNVGLDPVEKTQPRWPTMPFWPQSKIVLRRMTCEPTCPLSHPI